MLATFSQSKLAIAMQLCILWPIWWATVANPSNIIHDNHGCNHIWEVRRSQWYWATWHGVAQRKFLSVLFIKYMELVLVARARFHFIVVGNFSPVGFIPVLKHFLLLIDPFYLSFMAVGLAQKSDIVEGMAINPTPTTWGLGVKVCTFPNSHQQEASDTLMHVTYALTCEDTQTTQATCWRPI